MKRPLACITAAWSDDHNADSKQATQYCRAVYEAGFSPLCPLPYLPLILFDSKRTGAQGVNGCAVTYGKRGVDRELLGGFNPSIFRVFPA